MRSLRSRTGASTGMAASIRRASCAPPGTICGDAAGAGLWRGGWAARSRLTKARAAAARREEVKLAVPPETEPDDNYFIDTAEAEIKRLIGNPPLDLTVTTTFDPRLQDVAERTVK